ncbi:hypothetical protein EAE96_002943 [Botrytis aclada]|nr:hypothetical protein EAE96_002943 [Botrytis aclada]
MNDGMPAQDPENINALDLLPLKPDEDIVHEYLLPQKRDTWEHALWGLTPVNHLLVDGECFYDSENNYERLTYHDEMDGFECIEAACPNLEILTFRVEVNGSYRDLFRCDILVDSDSVELSSRFLNHVEATTSNAMDDDRWWRILRNQDLRNIYKQHAECLDRIRGRNSEYWGRVNMRVVLLWKPVYKWPHR